MSNPESMSEKEEKSVKEDLIGEVQNQSKISKSIQKINSETARCIENGQLQINENPQTSIMKPIKTRQQKNSLTTKEKLLELEATRNRLINQLNQIYDQQILIRAKSRQGHHKNSSKLPRSYLTKQQKVKITKAKKAREQLQQHLNKKLQKLYDDIQIKQQQLKQQQHNKIQFQKQKRKLLLKEKRIKTEQLKQDNKKGKQGETFKEVKETDYLYIKNKIHDAEIQKQREKYSTLILKKKKSQMKIDFQELRRHSFDHDQAIADKKEEFNRILRESLVKQQQLVHYPQTKFIRKLKQQQRHQKIIEQRQKNQKQEIRQKLHEFQEYVAENFKPQSNEKSQFIPKKKSEALVSMNQKERYVKGYSYLEDAKVYVKSIRVKKQISKDKNTQRSQKETQQATQTHFKKYSKPHFNKRYHNYLEDLKKNKHLSPRVTLEKLINKSEKDPKSAEKALEIIKSKQQSSFKLKDKSNSDFNMAKQKIALLNSILNSDL